MHTLSTGAAMKDAIEVKPLFYSYEKLIAPPKVMFRQDMGGKRYYYTFSETGEFKRFPSVTTILDATMPTPKYLIEWIAELGQKKAEELKTQKADYGTLMHICLSEFVIKKTFDLASLPVRVEMFKLSKHITYNTDFWAWELEKDIRAFEVFAAIHEIEPIAVGIMLYSERLGIAGELDLVINMRVGSGVNPLGTILKTDIKIDKKTGVIEDKTRRLNVIMDWKSGRHGFYSNNEAQLHLYKGMWNDNYPLVPIHGIYNWSPKDWKDEPGYNLKEQSDSLEAQKIEHYIKLFNISEKEQSQRYYPKFEGILKLGSRNGNFKLETPNEHLLNNHNKRHPLAPRPEEKKNGKSPVNTDLQLTVDNY